MKILYSSILFLCTTMSLMGSNTIGKSEDLFHSSPVFQEKPDTSIINRFIKVDPFNLSILPPSSGVQFFRDGIVFLLSSKSEDKMLSNHLSFGTIDARYAVLKDSVLENYLVFSPSANFPYPCEAITFSSDNNVMYFTKHSLNQNVEKIFQAKYSLESSDQGKWSVDEKPLSFCSDQAIYTHPALSASGDMMIFSSNRSGSIGGMDLYITRNNGETWSSPENLGVHINTKSNELFPFLDSESNLFFSSDGLQGYGGYDIFVCKFKDNTWEKPVNISSSINSKFDDVSFKINNKGGRTAFYTIKQKSGKRSAQLYKVTINNNAPNNSSSLSQLFVNQEPPQGKIITASNNITAETVKKLPDNSGTKTEIVKNVPEVKKEVIPIEVTNKQTVITQNKTEPKEQPKVQAIDTLAKKPVTVSKPQVKPEPRTETLKEVTEVPSEKKDVILYRVQILTANSAKGSYKITIDNKVYNTFEYFYVGGYRTCVGEFTKLSSAIELQTLCRKSGFSQAFVAAFKNNVRSTDPALFK